MSLQETLEFLGYEKINKKDFNKLVKQNLLLSIYGSLGDDFVKLFEIYQVPRSVSPIKKYGIILFQSLNELKSSKFLKNINEHYYKLDVSEDNELILKYNSDMSSKIMIKKNTIFSKKLLDNCINFHKSIFIKRVDIC